MSKLKECQVVMLPTNQQDAPICIYKGSNKPTTNIDILAYHTNQHLYILSDDEIKEGDWFYSYITNSVTQSKGKNSKSYYDSDKVKKIIATTDESLFYNYDYHWERTEDDTKKCYNKPLPEMSTKFIKKYCELGGIDRVMVEYETIDTHDCRVGVGCTINYDSHHKEFCNTEWLKDVLKISSDNTITIKPIKDSWSREEVIKLCKEAFQIQRGWGTFNDFIKENL